MRPDIAQALENYRNIMHKLQIEEAKLADMQNAYNKRILDRESQRAKALEEVKAYVNSHK